MAPWNRSRIPIKQTFIFLIPEYLHSFPPMIHTCQMAHRNGDFLVSTASKYHDPKDKAPGNSTVISRRETSALLSKYDSHPLLSIPFSSCIPSSAPSPPSRARVRCLHPSFSFAVSIFNRAPPTDRCRSSSASYSLSFGFFRWGGRCSCPCSLQFFIGNFIVRRRPDFYRRLWLFWLIILSISIFKYRKF